jgi:hypothetical protein
MTPTTYRSHLTGKTYRVETVTRPYVNPDTDHADPNWRKVEGMINGQGYLLDTLVFNGAEDLRKAHRSMEAAIESYLEGKNHPTHYPDFPEIVAAKEALNVTA